MAGGLRVISGGVPVEPVTTDPWEFQAWCVEAFVASWRARGFSPVTIENGVGLLERTLTTLGRPAWEAVVINGVRLSDQDGSFVPNASAKPMLPRVSR